MFKMEKCKEFIVKSKSHKWANWIKLREFMNDVERNFIQ